MADVSVSLDLQAKQLYDDLQKVQANFAGFASQVTAHGEKASTGFAAGFKSKISSIGSTLSSGLGLLGIGVGVGAVVSKFEQVIDKAHEIHHEAERFGIDAEQLQLIGNAAKEEGISLGQVAKAMNLIRINAQKDTAEAPLNRLGIDQGQFRQQTPQEEFLQLADAYKKSAQDGQAYADVAALIGKRNTELIPILALGREEIEKQGRAMGIISTKSVNDLDAAYKKIQVAQNQFTRGTAESLDGLKILYDFIGKLADKTPGIGALRRDLGISGANLPASELAIKPPPEAFAPIAPAPIAPTPIEELPLSPDVTQQELADKYLKEQGITDPSRINLREAARIQSDTEDIRAAALQSQAGTAGAITIGKEEAYDPMVAEIEAGMQRAFSDQALNIAQWEAGEKLLEQIRDNIGRGNL